MGLAKSARPKYRMVVVQSQLMTTFFPSLLRKKVHRVKQHEKTRFPNFQTWLIINIVVKMAFKVQPPDTCTVKTCCNTVKLGKNKRNSYHNMFYKRKSTLLSITIQTCGKVPPCTNTFLLLSPPKMKRIPSNHHHSSHQHVVCYTIGNEHSTVCSR
jgi:hypothetical protein